MIHMHRKPETAVVGPNRTHESLAWHAMSVLKILKKDAKSRQKERPKPKAAWEPAHKRLELVDLEFRSQTYAANHLNTVN